MKILSYKPLGALQTLAGPPKTGSIGGIVCKGGEEEDERLERKDHDNRSTFFQAINIMPKNIAI